MPGIESIPAAAIGTAKTVVSLINAGKAKKIAKELERTRPKREISPLYGQNLSLAESELAGGMSNAAEKAYTNQLDKDMSGSLSAILRGGGSVNNVADVFANGEEGRQRLALINDQLRLNQINNVVKAREMSAEEADKNFIFNDWMPWSDKSQANAEARREANAGIWSGLETMTGAATNALSNKMPNSASPVADSGMPNGQQMWLDYKSQQERDNAAQGTDELTGKFRTDFNPRTYNVPMFDTNGLYSFLNRPR